MRLIPTINLFLGFAIVAVITGCTPSKPIYLNDTGALNHFVDKATSVEYPDVETQSLQEVIQSRPPITVIDPDFDSFLDLTLEDSISYALQNGKLFRGYGTPNLQGTNVLPGQDTIVNAPNAVGTVYNVAIRQSEPGSIRTPGALPGLGSVLSNTQLDVNQGEEAALSAFDAQLTSSLNFTKTDEPRNTVTDNPFDPLVFQQDQVNWQTEIAKQTANGTQLFFRNVNTYTENSNPLDDPSTLGVTEGFQVLDSFYRASFEAEIRQPLLRGRGAFINRAPVVISRIGTDQEIANLDAQLQNFVTNVEIRYWDLYAAYRALEAAKEGRNAALETYRIVKDQFDQASDVNKQQVAQASEQYHFFDAQVVEAYNTLLNAEGQLRFLLGWAANDGRMIRPIDDPIFAPVEFDYCTTLAEALSYRPELRNIRWEIRKRELSLAYSKNSLLPELNATALYRFLGLGNQFSSSTGTLPFPNADSAAINELYDGDFQELSFGLTFGAPVGFRAELANVRNAQLKLAREVARLEEAELDVNKEIHENMRLLSTNLRTATSHFNRWRASRIEKNVFDDLQEEGLETLNVTLDAQRRLAQAEIAFYQSITEYNKGLSLLHRRKGTTLAYCGIQFEEGPWPGKAYLDAHEYSRRRSASRELVYGWTRPEVISRGEDRPSNHNSGYKVGNSITEGVPTYSQDTPIYSEGLPVYGDGFNGSPIPVEVQSPSGVPSLAPSFGGSASRNPAEPNVRQVSYEEEVSQPVQRSSAPRSAQQERTPAKQPTAQRARRLRATPQSNSRTRQQTLRTNSQPQSQLTVRRKPAVSNRNTARLQISGKESSREDNSAEGNSPNRSERSTGRIIIRN